MGNSTIERSVRDGHYLDLSRGESAVIEDPICEICKEPMEPIPPFGWVCLSKHQEAAVLMNARGTAAAARGARWNDRATTKMVASA